MVDGHSLTVGMVLEQLDGRRTRMQCLADMTAAAADSQLGTDAVEDNLAPEAHQYY